MLAFFPLPLLTLLLTPLSSAKPVDLQERGGIACAVPLIASIFCPFQSGEVQLLTQVGKARGFRPNPNGAMRFSVKYATSQRWQRSALANTWQTPNNDATSLPPKCPQTGVDPSSYAEDCLYMTLYVPANALPVVSGLPTIVWFHGGSFNMGSSTDPGLDGSNLAAATKSIVVVVQYRLGALGWLAPDSANVNLGLRDAINALQFVHNNILAFGGDPNKVTLAGQSSGAYLIRALLGTPSAQSLFKSTILHSDPVDFGFNSPATFEKFKESFFSSFSCSTTDTTCLNNLSLSSIVSANQNFQGAAVTIDPTAGSAQPVRVVKDGTLVTATLTGTSFPSTTKPMIITNVREETGAPIYGQFTSPLPDAAFPSFVQGALGSDRATTILASGQYHYSAATGGLGDGDDARRATQLFFTDYFYRCATWTLARSYASHGTQPYVGVFVAGATYPPLQGVSYCMNGAVCHQSDIYIVFGTTPSPTPAQTALTNEIQARYASFVRTGNPNPGPNPSGPGNPSPPSPPLPVWNPSDSTVHALQLGGTGEYAMGACDPSLWGASVPYDYQVFNQ